MEVSIRRAVPTDALFLTSISFGAKRSWNYPEEYFEVWHDELTITRDYINENVVFVAQKKDTIIGYLSIVEVEQGCWLDHIFIRPAYIRNGIGLELIEYAGDYCRANDIRTLHILSDRLANGFFEKIGARYIEEVPSSIEGRTMSKYEYEVPEKNKAQLEVKEAERLRQESEEAERLKRELEQFEVNSKYRYEEMAPNVLEFSEGLEEKESYIAEESSLYTVESVSYQPDDEEYNLDNEIYKLNTKLELGELDDEDESFVDEIRDSLEEEEVAALLVPNLGNLEEGETKPHIRTEKEKMLAGELYIAWGDEIAEDRRGARRLLREFNNIDPEDKKVTTKLLKELLGSTGEYIHIEPQFKCDYGYNIHVGDNFYASYNCVIIDSCEVRIGDNCILSPQVGIYTGAYPLSTKQRTSGYEYGAPVTIGDNVWIGGGAIINPGITIGNNVVIESGSVVVCDIPDNVVVGGNPAILIKEIED